jgi:glucose-1-phosphate thymidylyltransferase
VHYIRQEAPLGLAHAVLCAEAYLGQEPFVMYLGDNLILGGIRAFVDRFQATRPDAQILLARVKTPEQFGVAELDEMGRAVRLVEKPKEPQSDLALVGVYLFDHHIFDACKGIRPSPRGELEITDAIQHLIDGGSHVDAHVIEGWWKDTGKTEDLLEANRIILGTLRASIAGEVTGDSAIEGTVVVEAGARVVGSTLRGPLIIGEGAEVIESYVGPYTSIGRGCCIQGSEIEHSIVLEGSSVVGVARRIDGSLIGQNSHIIGRPRRPAALRIVVGDDSAVDIPELA